MRTDAEILYQEQQMSFFVFASLILLFMQVGIGLWFYFLFPSIGWKIPAVLLPLMLTTGMRLCMAYTRTHYGTLESIAYYLAYTYAGLVFILFFALMAFAIIQAICQLFHLHAKPLLGPLSLLCMAAIACMAVYGGLRQPKIKHIDITLSGAPEMTIAVISDSHLGIGVPLARFEKALARLKEHHPDALFVLGDLFEYGMHREKYAQALADFQTKYGSFGVFGNHEYYTGYDQSADFFKMAGIRRLNNEILTLPNGIQLIGINDIRTARITEQELDSWLAKTDPARTRILLSHQPLLTETAAKHHIPLMLSGHTHNGQIFPFNFFVKRVYPYVYGMYQTGPESRIYVTSGMFYWGVPLRFLAPAEIPLLHLKGHD